MLNYFKFVLQPLSFGVESVSRHVWSQLSWSSLNIYQADLSLLSSEIKGVITIAWLFSGFFFFIYISECFFLMSGTSLPYSILTGFACVCFLFSCCRNRNCWNCWNSFLYSRQGLLLFSNAPNLVFFSVIRNY